MASTRNKNTPGNYSSDQTAIMTNPTISLHPPKPTFVETV